MTHPPAGQPVLGKHFFFEKFPPRHLRTILLHASSQVFEKGSYLFHEHETADRFYFVCKGRISIGARNSGKKSAVIQTLGPDEVLGWSWLIPPFYWRFDAWAEEPTQVIVFDGKSLRELSEKDHDFGYALLSRVCALIAERLEKVRFGKTSLHEKKGGKSAARFIR